MDEKLTLNSLEKAYAQTAPGRGAFRKKTRTHPRKKQALAGVSLTLGPGLYGLLGPNGAGKSTLIGIITGTLAADSGEVLWCGRPARGTRFRRVLGYMPQQQGLYDSYTGRRFLAYMAALKELPRKAVPAEVDRVAAAVNLSAELDKRLSAYSGGMKQRLLLASALLGDPKLLILDEPTAGLDPRGRDEILGEIAALREKTGMTVVLVSHSMEDVANYVSRIIVMNHGSVMLDGKPREVFRHVKELEAVGLAAPQVTYIMHTLKEAGLVPNADATTLTEAVDAICEAFGVEDGSAGNSGTEDHSAGNIGTEKETDRC